MFSRICFIETEMHSKAWSDFKKWFSSRKKKGIIAKVYLIYLQGNFRRLINEGLSFYVQVAGVEEAENTVKLVFFILFQC